VASVALRQATAGSDLARDMRCFWRSLKPITGRARVPAWLRPRQQDVVDGQEAVRLHLVALACEILVLVRGADLLCSCWLPFSLQINDLRGLSGG
jgi:hypothetical protein